MPSPKQLAYVLGEVLKTQKKELNKPLYPQKKVEWIRSTAEDILVFLEKTVREWNVMNPYEPLNVNDAISTIQTALNSVLRTSGTKLKKG